MTLHEQLQSVLGATYTVERELGGGGMSRVFVATETALGRTVVIKVIAPGLLEGVSADRFTREVRLAARLQQANIVPLLSAGEANGLPYYTMPFVDGLSLRARLASGPPLSQAEANLAQAKGNLARDQATLENAQLVYQRDQELFKAKIIAQQDLDAQRAAVEREQNLSNALLCYL